ncbi:hypothetical protein INR49_023755 [Caranx melampygus]|nr:hypothetical protein INR49_023755 [Caranx melampygus]
MCGRNGQPATACTSMGSSCGSQCAGLNSWLWEEDGLLHLFTQPYRGRSCHRSAAEKSEGALELADCSADLPGLKWMPGVTSWKLMTKEGQWFSDGPRFQAVDTHRSVPPCSHPRAGETGEHASREMYEDSATSPEHWRFLVAVLVKKAPMPWNKRYPKLRKDVLSSSAAHRRLSAASTLQTLPTTPSVPRGEGEARRKKWGGRGGGTQRSIFSSGECS